MNCEKCGTPLDGGATVCPTCGSEGIPAGETPETAEAIPAPEPGIDIEEALASQPEPVCEPPAAPQPPAAQPAAPVQAPKKAYQPRWKPHIALRIPMQLLSLILCVILAVSLVATLVLADMNRMTSAGGIKQLISAVLNPAQAPSRIHSMDAMGLRSADITIPEEIFTGDNPAASLADWIYSMLQEASDAPPSISREQLSAFIERSTVTDFLAEKIADYADDYINGTENATITAEEILEVLEENEALMEQEFQIEITPEYKEQLTATIETAVAENDLNTMIRQEVFAQVDQAIEESTAALGGLSRDQIMAAVRLVASDSTLMAAIGVCAALMLLLCLLNFYNIPAGLTWIAIPCILVGAIMSAPILILQSMPQVIGNLAPGMPSQLLGSFVSVLAPIHYGLPALGLGLLVISIVWRVIRSSVERKRRLAAAM